MNNLVNWFTKRKMLLVGFLSSILFLILIPRKVLSTVCYTNNSICINSFNYLLLILMFGVNLFILNIIFYKIKDNTFYSWRKTVFIYLFIYLFIIIIIPWYTGDGFFHIQKDLIAVWFSVFYFVFSLFLIIYKSLKKE